MNVRACVTAVAALALLSGNEAQAGGPTTIRACGTIAEPGSYVLDRNIAASGTCLTVTAGYVTIDLNGFVISGDGSGFGVLVTIATSAATGFVLRNGTIDGFYNGIQTSGQLPTWPGALIERMTVVNSKSVGLAGGPMVVRDSLFAGNGNTAIALGEDSVALHNHVRGNLAGIHAGIGSTVEGNTVTSNSGFGISVECPALVIGNSSTGNSRNLGVLGTGCVLDHNVAP